MSLCVGEGWLGQGQERCYSFTLQLSACSLRGWRWTRGAGLVLCLWGSPPDALRGHSPSACRANPARSLWSLWSLCPGTASFALSHFALPWLFSGHSCPRLQGWHALLPEPLAAAYFCSFKSCPDVLSGDKSAPGSRQVFWKQEVVFSERKANGSGSVTA